MRFLNNSFSFTTFLLSCQTTARCRAYSNARSLYGWRGVAIRQEKSGLIGQHFSRLRIPASHRVEEYVTDGCRSTFNRVQNYSTMLSDDMLKGMRQLSITRTRTVTGVAHHSNSAPLYIGVDEVRRLLDPRQLFAPLEKGLAEFSCPSSSSQEIYSQVTEKHKQSAAGAVIQPVKTIISIKQHNGFLDLMPAYIPSCNALGSKFLTFYPSNTDYPPHSSWVMLFEPRNGSLLAIIDGDSITATRTAVASAIATKYLSDPRSRILAILGSGVQARSHYTALSCVRSFQEVRVWSRNGENARMFANEIGAMVCSSIEEAVKNADVICTVTFATTPLLMNDWIKPGAHINAVGACCPDWQEIDPILMRSSTVYCDSREVCLKESGDILLANCDVYAELGEVIAEKKEAFCKRTTVFKSLVKALSYDKLSYDKLVADLVSLRHSAIGDTKCPT